MTKEEAKENWMKLYESGFVSADVEKLIIDKIYDEFDAKHKYIIELIAHTAGSGNKAISQTLLTIDGILKEMMEYKRLYR